jgi:hypothetical protein
VRFMTDCTSADEAGGGGYKSPGPDGPERGPLPGGPERGPGPGGPERGPGPDYVAYVFVFLAYIIIS